LDSQTLENTIENIFAKKELKIAEANKKAFRLGKNAAT
jgi:Pyruvate/2-oxoacid:ferredoxin oxidoreductase gamma subunit